jgi:ParB family chromosome partitioning protein
MHNEEKSQKLPGEIRLVRVDDVIVSEKRMRRLGNITPLVDSIREIGLIEPIILRRETNELISGLHRLESVRALGQDEILARLIDVSGVQAEMVEIDENLVRIELTALERAEHIDRRKQLYEELHPEVKHGGAPGKAGGGKKKAKGARVASFAADTAKKTGLSLRTVQEDVQIAKLSPEAKRVVKGTPLADKKRELLALSRVPREEQARVARTVTLGEAATVAEIVEKSGGRRNAPVKSSPTPIRADLVHRPSERNAVTTRTAKKPPKPCWFCGVPGENPFAFKEVLRALPSGKVVEVTQETGDMRQIKVVERVIDGTNAVITAVAALPPGEERSRLLREAVNVISNGLRTLSAIVNPTPDRTGAAA